MRVRLDADSCEGHNRCYALAPELFDVDDYGQALVIGDGRVAPDLEDKARLAVANCPEYAITITEDPGSSPRPVAEHALEVDPTEPVAGSRRSHGATRA